MSNEAPTYKQCTKCGETKPLEEFSKNKNMKDGRQGNCKSCYKAYCAANAEAIRKYNRAYRDANPEYDAVYRAKNAEAIHESNRAYRIGNADKIRESKRAYRAVNAHKVHEYERAYQIANADKIRQQQRAYQIANADKIRQQQRAYRIANADERREKQRIYQDTHYTLELRREYFRAYSAANPDVYIAASHRYRARKKGNGGTFTTAELKAMRIEYAGVCFYCKGQHDPDALTIDHVIPIRHGGRHEAANIVLACGICNSSKGDRTPDQWTNRWYERKNRPKKK